jgi:hypothetical protein
MELATITLPGTPEEQKAAAKKAFEEYRAAVRERHDDEDAQIMRGYKAMAQGKQLLNLTDTIKAGGVGPDGRPRLAIMRADQRWCHMESTWSGFTFTDGRRTGRPAASLRFEFSDRVLPISGRLNNRPGAKRVTDARSLVPLVPPALRPAAAMHNFHILWEAEWQPVPPRDPALLRHVGGDLYAVVAIWDLTDLERAVLGGRFEE